MTWVNNLTNQLELNTEALQRWGIPHEQIGRHRLYVDENGQRSRWGSSTQHHTPSYTVTFTNPYATRGIHTVDSRKLNAMKLEWENDSRFSADDTDQSGDPALQGFKGYELWKKWAQKTQGDNYITFVNNRPHHDQPRKKN